MTYKTILTSKGTTTIPKEIRDQLDVRPGMYITFEKSSVAGEFVIKKPQTISDIRRLNKKALNRANTTSKQYKSGDGFSAFALEKHND